MPLRTLVTQSTKLPEERVFELEQENAKLRELAHAARIDLQRLRPNGPSTTFSAVDAALKTIAND